MTEVGLGAKSFPLGQSVITGCLPDASGMPPGCLPATYGLLISPPLQVTTKSCGHDARSIVPFNLLDQPRAVVMGSYPSIDHGIFGRLRPSSLVLNTFKIMYLDGWISQPKGYPFRQSDSFNKSSRLIHDRLLAPAPYRVNT